MCDYLNIYVIIRLLKINLFSLSLTLLLRISRSCLMVSQIFFLLTRAIITVFLSNYRRGTIVNTTFVKRNRKLIFKIEMQQIFKINELSYNCQYYKSQFERYNFSQVQIVLNKFMYIECTWTRSQSQTNDVLSRVLYYTH